uniref:RNase H type-1 domain-containing protein n=1 Tax=Fagus sylvatica TaxID=28930 RepID=A0A2N9ELP3_FAGSY
MEPPWSGLYKVNYDGTVFKKTNESGLGVIVRDSASLPIVALTHKIQYISSMDIVEALATRCTMNLALDMGVTEVELEGDCEIIPHALVNTKTNTLGTLALKTLSKPVASRLKNQAAVHPRFRQLIIDMAQTNHRLTTQIQRRIYGHATDVEIRPLNEEKAVQAAVDLIGELFVFSVEGEAHRVHVGAGVKEFIVFVARTAAKRTPPSQHQSVQHRGGETFMLFYPLQRHHPSTCVLTLTPNAFANITGSDPSELCFSTNSAVIFIEVLEVAYAMIFIGEKEGKKKGEVAAIVGAEDAGRMGLFWLVMEVWVCLVTGKKKIFVLGVAVILEVQRSARSEARKEELRKQELEAMRQRDEALAREVELLRQKLEELEQLAKGRGLGGIFNFKNTNTEIGKTAKPA